MIEVEIYVAGLRDLNKGLELDLQHEAVPGLRDKVYGNHEIVYRATDERSTTVREIRAA